MGTFFDDRVDWSGGPHQDANYYLHHSALKKSNTVKFTRKTQIKTYSSDFRNIKFTPYPIIFLTFFSGAILMVYITDVLISITT